MVRIWLVIFSVFFLTEACGQTSGSLKLRTAPKEFRLRSETLAPAERQELYLQLIEDFIGWAESSHWVDTSTLEPDGGYYNARGRGVSWERGNSNLCLTLAVLLTGRPSQTTFTKYNVPRSQLEDHLEKAMRSLCLVNKNYSGHVTLSIAGDTPKSDSWGGPSWQVALKCIGAAWAAHLMENSLSAGTLAMVEEVMIDEAENLKKTIPGATPGDTKAEDGIWNAPLLAFAANKWSSDPRASSWDEWAKRWALNSIGMQGDSSDNTTIVDGHPLSYWISTANVFADYTLENHGFWHPAYNLEFGRMAQVEMAYKEFGNPVPKAFSFRQPQMWDNLGKFLLLADGDSAYPQGTDWGRKDIQHQYYAAWHCTSGGRGEASAFESRGVQFMRKRQLNRGNGSVCDMDFGYHTDLFNTLSVSWLMHNYWISDSMAYDAAEVNSYGVKKWPYAKAAIHRNRQKVVSVSWHPYSQAIHIMPQEGVTTFPNPPFYFFWQRDSGVIGHVSNSSLQAFEITHNGEGMRVTVKRPMTNIDQYITVVSLPDEATVYSTIFHASKATSYSVGQLFPLQARWLSESPGLVTQRRGTNWLNMSDYVAFIAPKPLPEKIATDKFFLTEEKKFNVKAGQWFSPAAVVVYVRQTSQQTERLAKKIDLIKDLPDKELKLIMQSSRGRAEIDLWPEILTPSAANEAELFFREDWKEIPAEIPVTQEHVQTTALILKRHGPGGDLIKKSHHDVDPYYIWSGLCKSRWALALQKKNSLVDLSGGRICCRTRQSGPNILKLVLGLADGTWLVGNTGIGETADWQEFSVDIADLKWHLLDISTIEAGQPVKKPNLQRVRSIGWTDLTTGGSSAACTRVDWIEIYGKEIHTVKRAK